MRTLKKTLCLVLVLAMMVGLCAISASAIDFADYKDKDSIEAQEAVTVLSALGILQGDERGFRPNDSLTRAEGAKIMALLSNAKTGGLKSSFTDVAGTTAAWADEFIAFCEYSGIINGYGDGRFGPQDTLTYTQFAKMLLCALGYDAVREGYTGDAAWEINVVKRVNAIGLGDKVADFNYNDPITRNDAAQMAFNALEAEMVTYNQGLTVDTEGKLVPERRIAGNTEFDYRSDGEHRIGDDLMQFIEYAFPGLKVATDEDDYGLLTNFWFSGKNRQDYVKTNANTKCAVPNANVLKTYTVPVAVTAGDIYKDAHLTENRNLPIWENNAANGTIAVVKGGDARPLMAYNGAVVYLVDGTDNGIADYILVKYALLAKVQKVTEAAKAASKERTLELRIYNNDGAFTTSTFESEKYTKGEFVLVYPKEITMAACAGTADFTGHIIELGSPDIVKGNLGKVGTSTIVPGKIDALTVDGVRYSAAADTLAKMGPDAGYAVYTNGAPYTLNTEYTLYMNNGFILGASGAATPLVDYVFVISVDTTGTKDMVTGATTYKVAYAKQDGSTVVTATKNTTGIAQKWCEVIPTGETSVFIAHDTTAAHSAEVKNDTPNLGVGAVTNAKTNFVVRSGSANVTVKAYTGIGNIPNLKDTGSANNVFILKDATGTAAAVFLDFAGKDPEATSTKAVFFLSATPDGTVKEGPLTYYTYQVINASGELESVKLNADANTALTSMGLWIPNVNENGIITGFSALTGTYKNGHGEDVASIKAGAGVLTLANTYAVSGSVNIYVYTKGMQLEKAELEDIHEMKGFVGVIATSPSNNNIATIYVKEAMF